MTLSHLALVCHCWWAVHRRSPSDSHTYRSVYGSSAYLPMAFGCSSSAGKGLRLPA